MIEKLPPQLQELATPLWVLVVAAVAAFVGYLEDFKLEDSWKVWLLKFLAKSSGSGLAAVLAYHALLALQIDQKWHVVIIGVVAHMGTESMRLAAEVLRGKLG